MDGWSPDYPVIDELENNTLDNNKHYNEGQYSSDYNDYEPSSQDNNIFMYDNKTESHHHQKLEQERDLPPNLGDSIRSDISVDSIERNGGEDRGFNRNQESFLDTLQARDANIVQVTYPRTANNDKELTVVRGEFLEILDDSRKWWKARNNRGQVAHVPHTIVTPYHSGDGNNGGVGGGGGGGNGNGGNDIFNNPLYSTHNYNRNFHRAVSIFISLSHRNKK